MNDPIIVETIFFGESRVTIDMPTGARQSSPVTISRKVRANQIRATLPSSGLSALPRTSTGRRS